MLFKYIEDDNVYYLNSYNYMYQGLSFNLINKKTNSENVLNIVINKFLKKAIKINNKII